MDPNDSLHDLLVGAGILPGPVIMDTWGNPIDDPAELEACKQSVMDFVMSKPFAMFLFLSNTSEYHRLNVELSKVIDTINSAIHVVGKDDSVVMRSPLRITEAPLKLSDVSWAFSRSEYADFDTTGMVQNLEIHWPATVNSFREYFDPDLAPITGLRRQLPVKIHPIDLDYWLKHVFRPDDMLVTMINRDAMKVGDFMSKKSVRFTQIVDVVAKTNAPKEILITRPVTTITKNTELIGPAAVRWPSYTTDWSLMEYRAMHLQSIPLRINLTDYLQGDLQELGLDGMIPAENVNRDTKANGILNRAEIPGLKEIYESADYGIIKQAVADLLGAAGVVGSTPPNDTTMRKMIQPVVDRFFNTRPALQFSRPNDTEGWELAPEGIGFFNAIKTLNENSPSAKMLFLVNPHRSSVSDAMSEEEYDWWGLLERSTDEYLDLSGQNVRQRLGPMRGIRRSLQLTKSLRRVGEYLMPFVWEDELFMSAWMRQDRVPRIVSILNRGWEIGDSKKKFRKLLNYQFVNRYLDYTDLRGRDSEYGITDVKFDLITMEVVGYGFLATDPANEPWSGDD